MGSTKKIKVAFLILFSLVITGWVFSGSTAGVEGNAAEEPSAAAPEAAPTPSDQYVGTETSAACHEDQFKNFSPTKHAKLKEVASWKDKVVGCETCHGPGKAHVEDATNPKNIISFKGMSSKQASESCMACHAGKESHNNFRRGEHWRNDVGCTECHSPHGSPLKNAQAGSITFPSETSHQNPGVATLALLRQSEPQLCMSCHTETKSQFSKPFHHKVMEGTMKCTSCHNAHGGFEAKQARLAVGADASCVKCHSNKQGPFAFEHAPLKTEGCAACHTPHGSSNAKMLNRSTVRQTCLECHSAISDQIETPGVPTFHNQTQVRYQNCTVCHTAIHGSNSSNRFLRP